VRRRERRTGTTAKPMRGKKIGEKIARQKA